jgi:dCMP deaminase
MEFRRDKAIKYYKLAEHQAALFSKDPNRKVGAILLAPGSLQILSLGYNGMPRNVNEQNHQRWTRPIKYKYVEHAERNAVYNACRHGTPLEGCIAVVTMFPCCDCARALIQAGCKRIVTLTPDWTHPRWGDDFKISKIMFEEAGVDIQLLEKIDLETSPVTCEHGTTQ